MGNIFRNEVRLENKQPIRIEVSEETIIVIDRKIQVSVLLITHMTSEKENQINIKQIADRNTVPAIGRTVVISGDSFIQY